MTEFDKADQNGDGVIDREEWHKIELEDKRRKMEDADAQRDSQRRIVAISALVATFFGANAYQAKKDK